MEIWVGLNHFIFVCLESSGPFLDVSDYVGACGYVAVCYAGT